IESEKGEKLYVWQAPGQLAVIEPDIVSQMIAMLQEVIESGTGKNARLDRPAAGKTGTSQDYRNAWFVGFTPDLITGVWMGNDDNSPMDHVTGGSLPAKLWASYMRSAVAGTP